MRKLTFRQKKFVKETIKTLNPAEAARRAYNLGSKGGSKTKQQIENTSHSIASENLRKPAIIKSFDELLFDITDAKILNRLEDILNEGANRESLVSADMLLKLKNRYPKDQMELETGEIKVIIRKE